MVLGINWISRTTSFVNTSTPSFSVWNVHQLVSNLGLKLSEDTECNKHSNKPEGVQPIQMYVSIQRIQKQCTWNLLLLLQDDQDDHVDNVDDEHSTKYTVTHISSCILSNITDTEISH